MFAETWVAQDVELVKSAGQRVVGYGKAIDTQAEPVA
jgi:hypothetical protein